MSWQPDYLYEYERRVRIARELRVNKDFRIHMKKLWKHDPVAFINDLCITYDPRIKAPNVKTMPFMMFPRQEDFVIFLKECLETGESGLVEKCRDVGATWLCAAFSVWMWMFIPGASIGWGSRKEDLVDNIGVADSIFEKIRMIIRNIPVQVLPKGFDAKKDMPFMKIRNTETGATINGESGDNIGRGGRSSIYFKDESAHYERPEKIEAALGDNTDVQIDISSVNGSANIFYRRRMAGEIWERDKKIPTGKTRVFVFDWRDHPNKTYEWYERRRQKYADEGLLHLFAQEVDRDYSSSLDRVIIPSKWVEAAIDAHIILGFPASGLKAAALDVADEGGDKNAYCERHGVVITDLEDWGEGDTGETARSAVTKAQEHGISELHYDAIGVGAGVKSETNRLTEEGVINPSFLAIHPWRASDAVINPGDNLIFGDPKTPTNEDFFENLKAQAWWNLRNRFRKTYECVVMKKKYPFDELISIPKDLNKRHQLQMELSQAQRKESKAGKLLVDKKAEGAKSPNLAEACVMVYTPNREITIFDAL